MSIKTVYISGKVSGLNYDEVVRKFAFAQKALEIVGYKVINPVENIIEYNNRLKQAGGKSLQEYTNRSEILKIDIQLLLNCNTIYMLNDWQDSAGAMMEHQIAQTLEIKILYEGKKLVNQ